MRRLVVEGGPKIVDFDHKAFKPIPEKGISDAIEVMRKGMLYRYQPKTADASHTSNFEKKFADYIGMKHAVGTNSCGSAMFIALNIAGVSPGDKVLTNAFTFHAVPSVIHHAKAEPVLVECNHEWGIDHKDLEKKAKESGSKVLLLSYMRGHVPNINKVIDVANRLNLFFIEDCAHAYSTYWEGKLLGTFGHISCFSTQSSKGLSAGEGGIFVTNNDEYAAKAVLYAGSYERLWEKHHSLDPNLMEEYQNLIPGYSMRMHELTSSILSPQIDRLEELHKTQNLNFNKLHSILVEHPNFEIPLPDSRVVSFNDTMQFHLVGLSRKQSEDFIDFCKLEGIKMQIFGIRDNARDYRSWKYFKEESEEPLEQTIENIEFACDLSLQPHLTLENIEIIGRVLLDVIDYVMNQ